MNRIFLSFAFFIITTISLVPLNKGLIEAREPQIVFLKGTSSSGKSTLIRYLKQAIDDIEIIEEDDFLEAYPKAVAERFPLEYAFLNQAIDEENLYHALRTNDVIFKRCVTPDVCNQAKETLLTIQNELNLPENLTWKKEVSSRITQAVLNQIEQALKDKKDILLDAWYIKDDLLRTLFPENPIVHVMLYCSLPVAYERLLKRNNEAIGSGNLKEKRFMGQLMGSFCSIYQISSQPLQPISVIEKDELEKIFTTVQSQLLDENSPKPVFTLKELSKLQLEKIQKPFMEPFNTCNSETFYICPKDAQDLIIDNTGGDIQKAAESLEKIFDYEKLIECNSTFLI